MIRFPLMHVAQSVTNRIINVANHVNAQVIQPSVPDLPDIQAQGQAIDAAVTAPVGAVDAPEGIEEAIVMRVLDL